MNEFLKQLAIGFLLTLLMVGIIAGASLTAILENNEINLSPTVTHSATEITQPVLTMVYDSAPTGEATNTPVAPATLELSPTPSPTSTSTPTITLTQTKTTIGTLSISPTACTYPPAGWVLYTVQPGDTLFNIGQKFRKTSSEIQAANCMGNKTIIGIGEQLWVPNVATSTPQVTSTPTKTPVSATATATQLPAATLTPTQTGTNNATTTPTSTQTPTGTSVPPTATATLTNTPVPPTATPTSTPLETQAAP